MPTNKYLDEALPRIEHPRIRLWRARQRLPGVERMSLELRREAEPFALGPARIYLDFVAADGTPLAQDTVDWEWELDTWLVTEHVKARNEKNEAERMSLRLRHGFQPIQRKVGDGYFNSLLNYVVRQGPFADDDRVRTVLNHIHENRPYVSGHFDELVTQVDAVFIQRGRELVDRDMLRYERDVAEGILANALAQYLDERFHVTSRLQLFGR